LENDVSLCIVGNPDNRRVRDFQAAAELMRLERPACLSWSELLRDRRTALARLASADAVRIESPGEHDDVQHQLIRLGGGDRPLAFGEIGSLAEHYAGFCTALDWLSTVPAKFQNRPEEIKVMFDKWSSHQRFVEAGIPRPVTSLAPMDDERFYEFRAAFSNSETGRVFLKPRFASSASGVCAYRWSHHREQLIAPIEIHRRNGSIRLFNSLKVRSYTSAADIRAILQQLLPQGMICERWIRKTQLPGGQFDLRVMVIAGEARHTIVRQSHHPITNLHLGNRRGDLGEVRRTLGDDLVSACGELAEQAAACFPESLYAGVDILVPARAAPMVCEINAFGDLLPHVRDRDESTYEAILRAADVCRCAV
jgi:hypothetical protein